MNAKLCIFTGHRQIPREYIKMLETRLGDTVKKLASDGYTDFMVGGAMGFDRMAADAVLELRRKNPAVRLLIAVPCRDQDSTWYPAERRAYRKQLAAADEVFVLSEYYYDGCMRARNQYMVDRAAICVSYVTNPRSGAAQTVRMCERSGVPNLSLA